MFDLLHVKRLYRLVDTISMSPQWKAYRDSFLYGCRIKTLSKNTINGYAERLGYRNYTMLMLFYDTMIRRNELLTLTLDNVDLRNGLINLLSEA